MAIHRLRAVAGLAVAAAAATGCSAQAAQAPSPTPAAVSAGAAAGTPAPFTTPIATASARTETWTALHAGDCLAQPPSTDPAEVMVNIVDCAGPHRAEVFLREPIPVDAALTGTADAKCGAGFSGYTGTTPAAAGYTVTYLIDSDQDRTSNNPYPSTVICLLQSAQGQYLTGTARR